MKVREALQLGIGDLKSGNVRGRLVSAQIQMLQS